jgi:stage III sporulation protein SpoIIIAA
MSEEQKEKINLEEKKEKINLDEITSDDTVLLEKLKSILSKSEEVKDLDDVEIKILRKMIKVYESFQAFGRFAGATRNVIVFVGGLLIAWFTLFDNLKLLFGKFIMVFGGGQ